LNEISSLIVLQFIYNYMKLKLTNHPCSCVSEWEPNKK